MARRIARVVSTLVVAAGLLFGALLILPAALGWQRYVITSGSMTRHLRPRLARARRGRPRERPAQGRRDHLPPAGRLRPGGPRHAPDRRDRHRRVGRRTFRTKGDANESADPWTFALPKGEQARVKVGVPYIGFALAALGRREWRMLIVGLPAGLIALFSLAGLWRQAGIDAAAVPR